jgi:hypothetical protein
MGRKLKLLINNVYSMKCTEAERHVKMLRFSAFSGTDWHPEDGDGVSP